MNKLRIYLDNCCYNRPFDDFSQTKIKNEADAKIYIQSLIKFNSVALCTSFMLFKELNDSTFTENKEHILDFINRYSSLHISNTNEDKVIPLSGEIMKTGIKKKDATHLACSIIAECNYFITTDKRVLKYKTNSIRIVDPVDFVKIWRELYD